MRSAILYIYRCAEATVSPAFPQPLSQATAMRGDRVCYVLASAKDRGRRPHDGCHTIPILRTLQSRRPMKNFLCHGFLSPGRFCSATRLPGPHALDVATAPETVARLAAQRLGSKVGSPGGHCRTNATDCERQASPRECRANRISSATGSPADSPGQHI